MLFDIEGKIALVTGGASGIGLNYAKELLRNGAKAVALADVNKEFGVKAVKEIENEFGAGKTIFIQTDVTKQDQFERAFEETVTKFKNLDILFNNAGILNDTIWEKEIDINVTGLARGCILAIEKYLPKYKQGEEALIVNISSVAGTESVHGILPVYTATKYAVYGLTKAWGHENVMEKTKIRVVAICPGVTMTPLVADLEKCVLYEFQKDIIRDKVTGAPEYPLQEPQYLAKEVMNVVKYAPTGTAWVIEGNEPAYEYDTPNRYQLKDKNILKKY